MTIDPLQESVLSTLVVAACAWISMRVSIARLDARQAASDKRTDERLQRIERSIGISDTDHAAFVRHSECVIMERSVRDRLDRIDSSVGDLGKRLILIEKAMLGRGRGDGPEPA